MSKRNAKEHRQSWKRKKEGASYASVDLDALTQRREKVEDIRVWSMTMSEMTGHVTASRKNCQHIYEVPPGLLHKMPPSDAGEEIATPADPELSEPLPPASVAKRKRVRVTKENDSVSSVPTLLTKLMITRRQTRMADWLEYRLIMLDELLRKDGLGDSTTPGICAKCMKLVGGYRCDDCFGDDMYCAECIVSSHHQLPLHRVQVCLGQLLVSELH